MRIQSQLNIRNVKIKMLYLISAMQDLNFQFFLLGHITIFFLTRSKGLLLSISFLYKKF